MYIEKLQILNYKLFKNIIVIFNEKLNVFTGANNSGKTTILEALSLWQEIFDKLIIEKENNLFIFNKNSIYCDYKELESIKSSSYEGIFHQFESEKIIVLKATLRKNDISIDVSFSIKYENKNIFVIELDNKEELENINYFFELNNKSLYKPEPIFLTYPSTINNFRVDEKFQTNFNISKQVSNRNSISVLRNRIHALKRSDTG